MGGFPVLLMYTLLKGGIIMRKKILLVFAIIIIFNFVAYGVSAEGGNSVRAYRNINFGDSKEMIIRKIYEDPKIEPYDFALGDYAKVDLGGLIFDIFFNYNVNRLESIAFVGEFLTADYLDEVKAQRDVLVQIISNKYGDPAFYKDITIDDISWASVISASHAWVKEQTGGKLIEIGINAEVEEEKGELEYYALMIICYFQPEYDFTNESDDF